MELPQYPVYIISKGRYKNCLTAKFLIKDKVPFHLVVEPQEANEYIKRFGKERVYILPFSNLGQGSIPARNWVWEHAKIAGYKRHWILDDNIRCIYRYFKQKRIPCSAGIAFKIVEDFTERYENIAISGLNYGMFVVIPTSPFYRNVHVYSCLLILNSLPYRWRGRYNEDTDLCLQVLSNNWCTILINAFSVNKLATMTMKGGNMEVLYKGDGRLKMARELERVWSHFVQVKRRFKRPQHVINWRVFKTPLKLRKDLDINKLKLAKYDMKLVQVKPIKSKNLYNKFGKLIGNI